MRITGKNGLLYCLMILALFTAALFSPLAMAEAELELSIPGEISIIEAEQAGNPAEGYIRQAMYSRGIGLLRMVRPAGAALEGADAELYQQLRTKVAAIAAGDADEAFFSFPAEQIYEKLEYTAADLGVDAILVKEGGAWKTTPEAVAAMTEIIRSKFNQENIFRCLMADCPYELYWFDKTEGTTTLYPKCSFSATGAKITGNVMFYMAVSEEYREKGKDPVELNINNTKVYRYCYVGTQWGRSVTAAVQNARGIVNKYEDLEDYDRLLAYKNEIRKLAAYNEEAAAGEVPFGNPWQIIWVFDGNPDTKVVCEGYSKAFQYLNDLSSSDVSVICVTGRMNGEPHMWNLVKMDDGKNYLVDISNCPEDDAEYLFLTGYKSHDSTDEYGYSIYNTQSIYVYDESNIIRGEDELTVYNKGYLEAKPATPVFTPGKNADSLLIGEDLVFSLQDNQETAYDSFLVKITYIPKDSNASKKTDLKSFKENVWTFGSAYHEAGTYQVQFAGKCGEFTSLYSDPVILNPVVYENLGRLGFTDSTISSFDNVLAGDAGKLEWNAKRNGIKGYTVRMSEAYGDREIVFEGIFAAEDTNTDFSWAYCPGSYVLNFIPDVGAGYAYSVSDTCEIYIGSSGKEWLLDKDGILTRYFGSKGDVTVPEEMDGMEVRGIGPGAFDRSKAQKVTVPSFVSVDEKGFSGKTKLNTIYGYINSDAEKAAGMEEIQFVALGVKPGKALISLVSTGTGYSGYNMAVRLQEEADAVYIRETKKVLPCNGLDVLIPLNETGTHTYTLAAIKNDVRGDFGDYVSVDVKEPDNDVLEIPEHIQKIEAEAFYGVQAAIIRIPDTVKEIGEKAFAGNEKLQIVKTNNLKVIRENLFDEARQVVLCVKDAAAGFGLGMPFLLEQ